MSASIDRLQRLPCCGNANRRTISQRVAALRKPIKTGRIVFEVAAGTSLALFLLGTIATFAGNMGWIHLGESQPWWPVAGLEYGFFLGIVIGVIVAMKKASESK
jgi:hypothetical protein